MYSGFELCEAAPLPGREEYLDSEKYEIRVRDLHAPGNIVAEITAAQPHPPRASGAAEPSRATLLSMRSTNRCCSTASATPAAKMILVAVNLDPHHAQEARFEVPLGNGAWPTTAALAAEDLMHERSFVWNGKVAARAARSRRAALRDLADRAGRGDAPDEHAVRSDTSPAAARPKTGSGTRTPSSISCT